MIFIGDDMLSRLLDENGKPNKLLTVKELREIKADIDNSGNDSANDEEEGQDKYAKERAILEALLSRKMSKKIKPCVDVLDAHDSDKAQTLRKLAKVLKHLELELEEGDELITRARGAVRDRTASQKTQLQSDFEAIVAAGASVQESLIKNCVQELPVDDPFLARVQTYAREKKAEEEKKMQQNAAPRERKAPAVAIPMPSSASSRRKRRQVERQASSSSDSSSDSDATDGESDDGYKKKSDRRAPKKAAGPSCLSAISDELSGRNDTSSVKLLLIVVFLMYAALAAYTQKLAIQIAPIKWGDMTFGDNSY